ncbi:unnamed protein product [Adineta steineri]|uniref:Large-conductance mechanosensitive channel n=1 Tax=Adineta steineri TaxID=433720 RepID=A0A814N963_9BILA|nr:unnamed protein product [Adineta steineri]CAF1502298.1 unnamed protein product [Adineta steineri]
MACCARSIQKLGGTIREFAASGQLIDLAVAIVIGNAFTKTIESLVDNLLTPIIGFLLDGTAIGDLHASLEADRWSHKAPVILRYGKVLQQLIYFVIIVIMLSLIIGIVNGIYGSRRRNQVGTEQLPTRQELILTEHTNLLKSIARSLNH